MDYATWFNVLLNSNIEDIKKLCNMAKIPYEICHDNHFWISKFHNDHMSIPQYIDPQNMHDYVQLYIAEKKAVIFLDTILHDIIENISKINTIFINLFGNTNNIFNKYIHYKNNDIYPRLIISSNSFILDNDDEKIEIPKNLLLDILTHIFYLNMEKFIVITNIGPIHIDLINSKSYKNLYHKRGEYMKNLYDAHGVKY